MIRKKIEHYMQGYLKKNILESVDAVLRFNFGQDIVWRTFDEISRDAVIEVFIDGLSRNVMVTIADGRVVGYTLKPGPEVRAEAKIKEEKSEETDAASFFCAPKHEKTAVKEAKAYLENHQVLLLKKSLEAMLEGYESVSLPECRLSENALKEADKLLKQEGYKGCRLRRGKLIVAIQEEGMIERPKKPRKRKSREPERKPEQFLRSLAVNYVSDNLEYLIRKQQQAMQTGRTRFVLNPKLDRAAFPYLCRELMDNQGYEKAEPGKGNSVIVYMAVLETEDGMEEYKDKRYHGNTVSDEELEAVPFIS